MALTQEQLRRQAEKRIAADTPSGISRGTPSTKRIVTAAKDEIENQEQIENAKNYEQNNQVNDQEMLASVGLASPAQKAVATNVSNQPTQFVSQQAPSPKINSELTSPVMNSGLSQGLAGLEAEGQAIASGERQVADQYAQQAEIEKRYAEELQARQAKRQEFQAKFEEEESKIAQELEAQGGIKGDMWRNKSTGQQVMFAIGAFLGSLTPQGAQNISSIVNNEIERDIASQKDAFNKKQSARNSLFERNMNRFKDEEMASLATKNQQLAAIGAHIQKIKANTNSKVVIAKIDQAEAKLKADYAANYNKMMKKQESQLEGVIPGFTGKIQDPATARDFAKTVSSVEDARYELNNLLSINNKGLRAAFSFDDRASAKQSQTILLGKLREILVGPGSMSEGDKLILEEAIANPTDFFSLKSSNKIKLEKLKQSLERAIESKAKTLGLEKDVPMNAKRK